MVKPLGKYLNFYVIIIRVVEFISIILFFYTFSETIWVTPYNPSDTGYFYVFALWGLFPTILLLNIIKIIWFLNVCNKFVWLNLYPVIFYIPIFVINDSILLDKVFLFLLIYSLSLLITSSVMYLFGNNTLALME